MRERAFDRLLDRCLQETLRSGDVQATLWHHPREAHTLRPLIEVAMVANEFYREVPAPQGGLGAGRLRLLGAAAARRAASERPIQGTITERRRPMLRMALATKLVAWILSFVMGTTALGGGAVWAASDSLPGDAMYPVKRVAEELRFSVSTSRQNRVALALQFAAERGEEARRLAEAGRPIPEEMAAQVELQLRYALQQANGAPPQEAERLLLRIAEHAEEQTQLMAAARERLHVEDSQALGQIQAAFQQGRTDALEAVGLGQGDQDRVQDRDQQQDQIRDQEPAHAADQVREQERDQARNEDHEEDGVRDRDRDREHQYEGDNVGDLNPSAETEREREQERITQGDDADDEPERQQEHEQARDAQGGEGGDEAEREQEQEQERAAQGDSADEPEREREQEREASPQEGSGAGGDAAPGWEEDSGQDAGQGAGGDSGREGAGPEGRQDDDPGPSEDHGSGSASDPGQAPDAGPSDNSGYEAGEEYRSEGGAERGRRG